MIAVYCITSPSGKTYIGSSVNIERRWSYYKRLDCKRQPALYNSLVKYGVDNHQFEVIWECSKEELLQKEQMLIDFYKPDLNICKTAGSGPSMPGEKNPNWKGGVRFNNPEEYDKQYRKQYNQANKERIKENIKQYKEANKEKLAEYKKQYDQANKEKNKEYMKQYHLRKKAEQETN